MNPTSRTGRFHQTNAWRKIAAAYRTSLSNDTCHICHVPGARHVDHIKARSTGGTDDFSNLQLLCSSCHSRKTAVRDGAFGNKRNEQRSYGPTGCNPDGSPLDPNHWWNK